MTDTGRSITRPLVVGEKDSQTRDLATKKKKKKEKKKKVG